jgi:hypothetical protein
MNANGFIDHLKLRVSKTCCSTWMIIDSLENLRYVIEHIEL